MSSSVLFTRDKIRKLCALLVGMQNDAAAMENSMEVPQKIKNKTTVWSSNSTFGYIFKGNSKDLKGIFTLLCLLKYYLQ